MSFLSRCQATFADACPYACTRLAKREIGVGIDLALWTLVHINFVAYFLIVIFSKENTMAFIPIVILCKKPYF